MGSTSAFRTAFTTPNVGRGLDGFTARHREPALLQPCGVPELDAMLGGGFPRGSLVEVCGPASSGRTSLSLALLAQATQRQEACAFVDVSDALDPMSVAAAGADLTRLLWIRCGGAESGEASGVKPASRSVKPEGAENKAAAAAAAGPRTSRQVREKPPSFSWTHPRDQMRGIETSIPSLVRQTVSSGAPMPETEPFFFAARCAGEQVEIDRQGPRRGDHVRERFLARPTMPGEHANQPVNNPFAANAAWMRSSAKPWKRLEQALKTTDLLLHSGGWGVVVFDLGGISWTDARRIPMNTWFRFRRVVENSPTILLLLGEETCAKSCASLVLRCQRLGETWSSAGAASEAAHNAGSSTKLGLATLQGFEVQGEIACSRMQRLGTDSARWPTRTFWTGSF